MSSRLDLPPPPVILEHHGGGSRWVELTRARNDIDAHLLLGRLGEDGIETRTIKDIRGSAAWLYGGSNPWGPVAVYVRSIQLEDARLVLAEISFEGPAAVRTTAAPDRGWRVPLVWWITALLLGLFLTAIALMQVARAVTPCQLRVFCDAPAPAQP